MPHHTTMRRGFASNVGQGVDRAAGVSRKDREKLGSWKVIQALLPVQFGIMKGKRAGVPVSLYKSCGVRRWVETFDRRAASSIDISRCASAIGEARKIGAPGGCGGSILSWGVWIFVTECVDRSGPKSTCPRGVVPRKRRCFLAMWWSCQCDFIFIPVRLSKLGSTSFGVSCRQSDCLSG